DTFDESSATTTMTINLTNSNGTSNSAEFGVDTLTSIENINTGSGDDIINLQDAVQNIIDGGNGNDIVTVSNANTSSTLTVTRAGNNVTLTDSGTGFGNDQ